MAPIKATPNTSRKSVHVIRAWVEKTSVGQTVSPGRAQLEDEAGEQVVILKTNMCRALLLRVVSAKCIYAHTFRRAPCADMNIIIAQAGETEGNIPGLSIKTTDNAIPRSGGWGAFKIQHVYDVSMQPPPPSFFRG